MPNKKSIFDLKAVDPERKVQGYWHHIAQETAVKIRSRNSKQFAIAYSDAVERYKLDNYKIEDLTEEESAKVTLDSIIEGLIVDWKGFYDNEGNEIPYSMEKAKEIFYLPEMEDFALEIWNKASDLSNFKKKLDGKNTDTLKKTSNG